MKPQDVTNTPGEHAIFMIFGLQDGDEALAKVKDLCADFTAVARSMRTRLPDSAISCIMGFGAEAWSKLFPKRGKPKELEVFKEIKGSKYTAVSTPGDIFLHIRAARLDVCLEAATIISSKLHGAVYPIDEVQGFRYFDGRAIIGFVDGTENPEDEARLASAAIGVDDADFAGGSYAFVQKYLHDMNAWNALSTEEQEKAIGRRKFNDVELSDEEKPENAHNAVTNIEDEDGNELKIVRANMAFANPAKGEFGTYFIGYAGKFSTTRKMLENMFIGEPIGNTDRLLDFSTAATGTLFFVPSADLLEELGED
ncbi:Dyp-type peroxidase [Desulfovibrio intestinalis]|uniref:Putative iron-dependent peroxidase n=1 Tax=Desulfovibrio intestinalis TaxID=58621 RepID=A0A7W8FGR8_9BACT|nr:Dyp-type peroxidase [Desulfovibrio intestinalis]MBB5144095.1 putative iron-dependent peroxidase [Desulfovibrio intestinalis]